MQLHFYKYQGAGNDFIIIDNRQGQYNTLSERTVAMLCERRFGIGADGLMLLQPLQGYDFEMVYFNADGRKSSMCGNGGRCIAAFASFLGLVGNFTRFMAVDGEHEAKIPVSDYVELKMGAVSDILLAETHCFLNTGSPHDIRFVPKVSDIDVFKEGRAIRNSEPYREQGANVNFVEVLELNKLLVATYERGVEDETLACGTGVTAAALAYFLQYSSLENGTYSIAIEVKGGNLKVNFNYNDGLFSEIWLCGPAVKVFEGKAFIEY